MDVGLSKMLPSCRRLLVLFLKTWLDLNIHFIFLVTKNRIHES